MGFRDFIRNFRGETDELEISEVALAREFIRSERDRLKSSAHSNLGNSANKLNRKRFADRKARELAAELLGRKKRKRLQKSHLTARFRASPILDGLIPTRRKDWIPVVARPRDQTAFVELRNFSFLEDPAGTLSALRELAKVSCRYVNAKVNFVDKRCLDIGAYLVLSEIWPALFPSFTGGDMPPTIQKVLEAVGLREVMRMKLGGVDNLEDVWAFPVRRRVPFGSLYSNRIIFEAQRDQITAQQLCGAIDFWLGIPEPPHELSVEGKTWISTIILELLNNAQRHSAPETSDGNWSIAAFMSRVLEEGVDVFNCHLGILSVGASIDESLRTCTQSTANELDQFVSIQRNSGRSDATLRTLYALQDGVTRDPRAAAKRRGGVGLQDVIELVNTLGGTSSAVHSPKITIISGRSCISVRDPYIVGQRMAGERSPRTLWFNAENSPQYSPNSAHVFDLEDHFAGTIVSVMFRIDGAYLRRKHDENNQSGRSHG